LKRTNPHQPRGFGPAHGLARCACRSDRSAGRAHFALGWALGAGPRSVRIRPPARRPPMANLVRQPRSQSRRALGARAGMVQRSSYSKTALCGKARAKNAQCAALVVRALRPIIPNKKIVKPHAVRRSLRARMTGSLDPTRHTGGRGTPEGASRSRVACAGPSRGGYTCQLGPLWQVGEA